MVGDLRKIVLGIGLISGSALVVLAVAFGVWRWCFTWSYVEYSPFQRDAIAVTAQYFGRKHEVGTPEHAFLGGIIVAFERRCRSRSAMDVRILTEGLSSRDPRYREVCIYALEVMHERR